MNHPKCIVEILQSLSKNMSGDGGDESYIDKMNRIMAEKVARRSQKRQRSSEESSSPAAPPLSGPALPPFSSTASPFSAPAPPPVSQSVASSSGPPASDPVKSPTPMDSFLADVAERVR